jgi:spore germination cell wall hydrolase CwlJ-like protein
MLSAVTCLSLAIYHEARGEPIQGQLAVAQVVMNRVASRDYPDTVCDVVTQPKQFSFLNRTKAEHLVHNVRDKTSWKESMYLAKAFIQGHRTDLKATHYHAKSVRPVWADSPKVVPVQQIGNHLFYIERR